MVITKRVMKSIADAKENPRSVSPRVQTVDKSPISSERDWTFSMYKMKINVEISMIKAINMI